jgi:hypothetical protein
LGAKTDSKAPAPASGGFSFGAKTDSNASAPASGGFSFGAKTDSKAPAFNFGGMAAKPLPNNDSQGGGDGGEDDDEVPPEEVVEVGKAVDTLERDVVYEVRAKISQLGDERDTSGTKIGQEWKEMGVGTLQLLYGKGKESGKRFLLMRDDKLGKVKLNTLIVANMKFDQAGKSNIRFFAQLEVPEVDDTGKILSKTVVKTVLLNLKVPKDHLEEATQKLREAVPK